MGWSMCIKRPSLRISWLRATVMVAIIISFVQTYFLSAKGLYSDSSAYFYFFNQVKFSGLISAVSAFYSNTGKIEPGIFVFYYLFSGVVSSEYYFLLITELSFNLLLVFSSVKAFTPPGSAISKKQFYIIVLALLSYMVVSKTLFMYRMVFGFVFMLYFLGARSSTGKISFFLLSVLSHNSFLAFIPLLIFSGLFSKFKEKDISVSLMLLSVLFPLVVLLFYMEYLSFFVSGNISEFKGYSSHSINLLITIFFGLFMAFIVFKQSSTSVNALINRTTLYFVFLISILAIFISKYYQAMSHLYMPVSCIIPFLPLMLRENSSSHGLTFFLLILSVLPTVRIYYNFL